MARLLKNPTVHDNPSFAVQLPIVPNSSYGDAPIGGLLRFNQATNRIEFYYNNSWSQVAKIGTVQLVTDSFSGDGTTSIFYMSQAESDPTAIAVFVGGVYQQPAANGAGTSNANAYSVNGSTAITFSSAPPQVTGNSPTQIIVIHNINSTNVPA
jgi:hypothetical protein